MKKILVSVLLLLSVSCLAAEAAVTAAVSSSSAGNSFYLSIGDYFSVPQREVVSVSERSIPDEEIPVVFFLAQKARVTPSTIMNFRLKGNSWMEIANRYGFGAEIFYVHVDPNVVVGAPYGHAYGFYNNKPRKDWRKIELGDDEVVNMVNLKFISGHYGYPAGNIMKMREKSKGFYAINDDIRSEKEGNKNRRHAKAESDRQTRAAHVQYLKQQETNPDHLTGTKKQVSKVKKFYKKHNDKAKKYINDKG